jgi:nucleoside-diphosphate-sugar epimerase
MSKKIAILGATSHIAKGLIVRFLQDPAVELFLFARTPNKVQEFLEAEKLAGQNHIADFSQFLKGSYDVVINCVGMGTPQKVQGHQAELFLLTEKFDDLCLEYLQSHETTLYINFSSGAVHGKSIVQLKPEDYYAMAKRTSEAKHRAFPNLNIIDLRVFAYFSRFIDLQAHYLITEIITCVKEKKEFVTGANNIVRDYCHPADLFSLVTKCISYWQQNKKINKAFDVYSKKPVSKMEIIEYFQKNNDLKVRVTTETQGLNATGNKDYYCSEDKQAETIGYKPDYTALEAIALESKEILR